MLTNPRMMLAALGIFFLGIGYTTYHEPRLQKLPVHGPLVLMCFIGLMLCVVGTLIKEKRTSCGSISLAILISYCAIRGLNSLGHTIELAKGSIINAIEISNEPIMWFFTIFILLINYHLHTKSKRN